MAYLKNQLKEILIRDNLISPEDIKKASDEQIKSGGELSHALLKLNLIGEDALTPALMEILEIPYISISRLQVESHVIDIIPYELTEKHQIIPISLLGDSLTLAIVHPLNLFAMDNIKALTGHSVNLVITREKEFREMYEKYYTGQDKIEKSSEAFEDIIKDFQDNEELELIKDIRGGKQDIEEITEDAPIIKLIDTVVKQAVKAKASDIFIEPLEKAVRVRYRIDGVIQEVERMSKALQYPIVSRIKVISNLDISEHRLPQDGRFKIMISGNHEVSFRVNVLPTALGEKVVLRVLDQSGSVLDVEKLGFEPESMKRLKDCSVKPHGLILTCGPTGSGKTTTLYSILKFVDSPGKNIVTVEDPVEYPMKGANQVNINITMGLTFASSLRSILRQDPDVILIGEIRDADTLDIAVKAALTGHLVLSSLHTTTAAGSVIRMMNMGIEPFLICSSVLAIVAQRLLRRICAHCQESYIVPPNIAEKVGLSSMVSGKEIKLLKGKGCKSCFNTGYKGRVGITEILVLTPRTKELILAREGEFKIKHMARLDGMKTMREDGFAKALAELTTLEEVLRITAPDELLENN